MGGQSVGRPLTAQSAPPTGPTRCRRSRAGEGRGWARAGGVDRWRRRCEDGGRERWGRMACLWRLGGGAVACADHGVDGGLAGMLGARRRRGGASGGAARWEAAGDAGGGSRKGRRGRRTTRRPDGLATRTTKIGYKGGADGLLVAAWGRGRGVSRPWRGWRRCEAAGDAGGLGEGPWRESDHCVCAGSVSAGGSRGPAPRRRQSGSGPINESGRGAIAMNGGPVSGAPTDPTVCAPRSGGAVGLRLW